MSIVGDWVIKWTLPVLPYPGDPRSRSVVIKDEHFTIAELNSGNASVTFKSASQGGASVTGNVSLQENGTQISGIFTIIELGNSRAYEYTVSAIARGTAPDLHVSGWVSCKTNSENNGGQWGVP